MKAYSIDPNQVKGRFLKLHGKIWLSQIFWKMKPSKLFRCRSISSISFTSISCIQHLELNTLEWIKISAFSTLVHLKFFAWQYSVLLKILFPFLYHRSHLPLSTAETLTTVCPLLFFQFSSTFAAIQNIGVKLMAHDNLIGILNQ